MTYDTNQYVMIVLGTYESKIELNRVPCVSNKLNKITNLRQNVFIFKNKHNCFIIGKHQILKLNYLNNVPGMKPIFI